MLNRALKFRLVANFAAAGLVALTLVGVSAPAQAAACEYGKGVTVVVQGHGLNGTACVPGGGKPAKNAFPAAGYPLTYTQRFPGFVCRVSGKPASDHCQTSSPPDAYWGLFWSDGKGGGWKYATCGVECLNIPQGGWVALKFQNSNTRQNPSVNPVGPKPAPTQRPTTKPTPRPTPSVKPKPTPSASQSVQTSATPSAQPTATPTAAPTGSTPSADVPAPTPSASLNGDTEVSSATAPAAKPDADSGPGVGTWIVIAGLIAAGGLLGWRVWRRR